VPAYASALFYRDVPDLPAAHAAEAAAFVARGYRAVKMKIGRDPALDRERVLAVRRAIGPRPVLDRGGWMP